MINIKQELEVAKKASEVAAKLLINNHYSKPIIITWNKKRHERDLVLLKNNKNFINIFEFAPRKVKMSVCGNGGASKEQVQYMVMKILNLKDIPGSLDVSDAIAVGICCLNQVRI